MREHMGSLDFAGIERIMVDTLFTALVTGAGDATRMVERRGLRFADTYAEGFGTEPLPPQKAIEYLQKRVPLPLKRLETLLEDVQAHSAFITRDILDTVSNRLDRQLEKALESGDSLRDYLLGVDDAAEVSGLSAADPFYWETVFRTNVQTAYHAGREEMLTHPDVTKAFPYFQYLTVEDSAVRPTHAALHGLVWRADAPEVKEFFPPNGFNCRCNMVAMDDAMLAEENLKVATEVPKINGKRVVPDHGVLADGTLYSFSGSPSQNMGLRPPGIDDRPKLEM